MTVFLIGCKADLEDQRAVQKEQAREFCVQNKIVSYFETSAKTGANVEDVFATAAKDAYLKEMKEKQTSEPSETPKADPTKTAGAVKLNTVAGPAKGEKKKGCC